jgi:threonylcarbamoyladenosine tRNA methylthiotransferase MtaB
LSLQSGCTETLKRMNRRYTAEEFEVITQKLRNAYSDVILTTDIIVGFAGETEEEFETTYNFLKRIKFYKTHIFKYSERKGTKAAEMKNQVSPEKKEERSKKLIKLSDENEEEYLNSYIGKAVEVLFEESETKENLVSSEKTGNLVSSQKTEILANSENTENLANTENTEKMKNIKSDGNLEKTKGLESSISEEKFYKGHTANYIVVKAKSKDDISNKILKVKIEERNGIELIGDLMVF